MLSVPNRTLSMLLLLLLCLLLLLLSSCLMLLLCCCVVAMVDISILVCYMLVILYVVGYDKSRPGLPSAPLDMEYDNNSI